MPGRHILAIGAHPDDIELGCGGALIKHVAAGDSVAMLVITRGEVGPGRTVERILEQENACRSMGVEKLIWGDLPDCRVSLHELALVHLIEKAIRETGAELIYTHSISDSHQDHRTVAVNTMGAARKCSNILSYDAPSSMQFRPTVFVDISDTLDKKVDALMCHGSQVEASEMVDAFKVRNSAGYRGHEARVGAAEAFEAMRYVMAI
jgi:LmbE family N-acetylglucosaminyl deacetylase